MRIFGTFGNVGPEEAGISHGNECPWQKDSGQHSNSLHGRAIAAAGGSDAARVGSQRVAEVVVLLGDSVVQLFRSYR